MYSSKTRFASLALAVLMTVLLATQALAYEADTEAAPEIDTDVETETVEEIEETEETETVEEPDAVFYLDGQPLYEVEAEQFGGTYYVTLRSILPLLDPSAVVEEAGGIAAVTAQAVAVTEPKEADETEEEAGGARSLEDGTGQAEAVVEVLDTLVMSASEDDAYVVANGRYLYVKSGVKTLDGAVAVPVRTLANVLGLTVGFDKETGHVTLTTGEQVGYLTDAAEFYDENDLYWLSRIIHRESGNQPLEGKIAVGNVVLNRVNSPMFPDNIYDVLLQKNQFCNDESKLTRITPNQESVIAAMLALDGATALEGVLFFNRAGINCFASRNRPYIATIGAHAFYG